MAVRILVTGGSGFIGRHAVAALHNLDFEVHVIGRQSGDKTLFAPQVMRHQADILNRRAVSDLIRTIRPTHLLHLAWITTHGAYWRSPDNLDWLAATVHLARAFAEAGGSRMITAGTSAEYDWTDPALASSNCFEYLTPIVPRTFYGVTKDACRRALEAYSTESGIQTAWGRVFFLFGPSEDQRRLVPSIIANIRAGRPAPCTSGTQVRDFLAVEDVGAAFAALTVSNVCGAVNLSSGEPRRVADVANAIGEIMGRPDLVALGALPSRPDDPPRLVGDVSRLQQEVGFVPSKEFRDRLAQCIATTAPD